VSNYETMLKKSSAVMMERIRKGIPKQMRELVWQKLANSESQVNEEKYAKLCKQSSPYEKLILRDIHRTFPQHEFFKQENGQELLLDVMRAYANYDPEVGYCQGLGFIAGVLLMHMQPQEAFSVLVQFMNHYNMRFLYLPGMEGVHIRMYQLEALIKEYLPALANHLQQLGVQGMMFASGWFITVFATELPLETVFRVFDVFFLEGFNVLFNFSLALLKKSQLDLLKMNFEDVLETLKTGIFERKYLSTEELFEDAFKFKLSPKKLEKLEKEGKDYFDAKSEEEKTIQILTREKVQLENEVEMYRNLYSQLSDKQKMMEDHMNLVIEENETLKSEKKFLLSQLNELKSLLSGDQQHMYNSLEDQVKMYKIEYAKVLANQTELEGDLIATKLKYALAESERQRLLIRAPQRHALSSMDAERRLERLKSEGDIPNAFSKF